MIECITKKDALSATHTFAEGWLREFAGRIITGTDSAQATYVATSLRDQIIKEMKGK